MRDDPAQHRLEGLQRHGVVVGFEAVLIVQMAELRGVFELRMAAVLLAHVAVQAQVMEEVIALENAVLVHHHYNEDRSPGNS